MATSSLSYMANFIALIVPLSLLFSTFNTAKAQFNVTRGSSLTPTGANTSWLSPSGLYSFGFYPQTGGYAVGVYIAGIAERTAVWTANRDTLPLSENVTLRFTNNGRLILVQTTGKVINIADTIASAAFASMEDSGNFVLYDSDQTTVLWQSFDNPTDTLLGGQRLLAGQTLFSDVSETDQSIGIFKLRMQEDGNLVQYPNGGTEDTADTHYWATDTGGITRPKVTLNLDSDGFLYLLENSTIYIRNLTQGGYPRKDAIYRMKIDLDGIFRVYYHDLSQKGKNGSVIWSSSTDKCTSKGLCGLNGYCLKNNDAAQCRCLPGFDVVDLEFRSLGCHRNYTTVSCDILDAGTSYYMTRLDNTQWEDLPYAIPKASTQAECESACLNDCNCEAALFTSHECRLQRLPIRYMQIIDTESSVGLIKMYSSDGNGGSDQTNPSIQMKKTRQTEILVIGISLLSFAVFILLLSLAIMYRTQIWAYRKISENANVQLLGDVAPQSFSYVELERATDGFKEELGRGSFGIVYKGVIESSKKDVAVKKLKQELAQGEGEREFQTEMKVIGRTHHRNLVKLLGYCCEGPERILVFEYMKKGSLAAILFGPNRSKPCWEERIRMALDIARGIVYLHEECETLIIHCDIKPQNILMNEDGCAKISDFGLAKLLEHDQTRTFTEIRGTRGYVAPEWHKKLPITVKADVYSFGVVLFEILCCRRYVDNSLPDFEAVLVEWVYDCYEGGEVLKLVADEDVDKRKLNRMIRIGLWCIQDEPSLRPSMKKVLLMLEGTVEIPIPPNPSSFLSVSN